MIYVDEADPVGEIDLSFPPRDVQIKRGEDPKDTYDLKEEVGRGKFGTVYRCIEKQTNLSLAAKFIGVPKKEDRRNVEREIDIMRSLQHPRLIQLYDAFENGKTMCVILELIEGGELFERVIDDDFVLTEKSCTVFMRQICEGVDFIHKQKILHLDMKPENILCLSKTGNRIKIIDFGLARRYDPSKKLQVLFGTPEFVAPEVVNFDMISYGTDMWSVGVICYVLLSGLSPFMGQTDIQTMSNVTIAKYDFDDEAFNEISEIAKDFIRKLLLKDIDKRMTAEDCLNHRWLKKQKLIPRNPSMETTKDNLKIFIDRWNEHPNSPYIFEMTSQYLPNGLKPIKSSDSVHSLIGLSPSPCGSVASSPGSDNVFLNDRSSHIDDYEHLRRSSDSTGVLRSSDDISERINLAEEIKKLSEKLYQLSQIPTTLPCLDDETENAIAVASKDSKSEPTKSLPIAINNNQNGKIHSNSNIEVPWRRAKYKLSHFSRDVPLLNGQKDCGNYYSSVSYTTTLHNQEARTPTKTKDLLLRLLEHWDGPHRPCRQGTRHSSISLEWLESESLGQKTISSLNSFFQSRSATKKITPFHLNDS